MAKRYRPVRRDQPFLLPPDMRDWLAADHPVWLVITAVEDHLDTSAFHALRRAGGAGTAGYDPDMLVTVLVWAYAHQVTSSRRIEQLCGTDAAFRVICGGQLPDHATFARFRAAFPAAIGGFFAEVLALCARLGMGKLGVVALDGMKIAANASKSANRTQESLARLAAETVAAHAGADAAEDVLFGEGRAGDEVPGDAWRPGRRGERIAAALAGLAAERAAAEAERAKMEERYLAEAAAGTPRAGNSPAGAAVELARMKVERARAAQQAKADDWQARNDASLAETGKPLRGSRPVPADSYIRVRQATAKLERARAEEARRTAAGKDKNRHGTGPVRNLTDPDSRLMPVRGGGFLQGYNAENVTSEDGLIMATELTGTTTDTTWFQPMMAAAEDAAALIAAHRAAAGHPAPGDGPDSGGAAGYIPPLPGDSGGQGIDQPAWRIGLFLSDAGYCSQDNINAPGPPRLIATGKLRDLEKAARSAGGAPRASPAIAAMAALLQTADGIAAYRQRGHIAETPHGNIKHNMAFDQLSVRGKPRSSAEWKFAATIHNLFKAISSGHLTAEALGRLGSRAAYPPITRPAPA